MKEILLDTHAFLWFIFDDPRLSAKAAKIIEDRKISNLLSVVSLWEITIKSQLGKLHLGMKLEHFFTQYVSGREIELIDIELPHLLTYDGLPLFHRDPFDRLLVAKAIWMNIPILSADPVLASYDVQVVW